ncbi:hypothetical protein PHLCEN_2v3086 [Hermanssonia centrifuga]|uniref:Uncharacterized protein n=1 Tax=Hermanssonia centrifuga TaxID=98765 RepID=A0A2R6R759_9APHY|nr:hypothetical protein PHLCEN_2v3086 [Hermanssonia centrifuga]
MVLDYVHVVAQHHNKASGRTTTSHIRWVPDTSPVPEYPAPDFHSLLNSISGASAVILSMRHLGAYDGGVEYLPERLMKPLVGLLFHSYPVAFLSDTDCIPPDQPASKGAFPLLVVCGSSKFTAASRMEMAEAVRPTLLEMTRHHDPAIPLPRHYFVYGLHWSQFFLHIFIHLPVYIAGGESDSGHWEFCQIVVSEHTITLEEFQDGCRHNQDDMVLDRWRLTIALASVQRHMSLLEQIIYPSSDASSSQSVAYSPFVNGMADDSIACLSSSCFIADVAPTSNDRFSLPDFPRMRTYWRGPQFSVPAEWIPIDGTIIDAETGIWLDESKEQKRNLGLLYLDHLRTYLVPIPKDIVLSNQFLETYHGPDFLHLVHSPRAYIPISCSTEEDWESNTLPHLYRVADFLAMAAASWHDVNIFIATLLAGFHGYIVRWNPTTIRYPFSTDTPQSQSCIVDFALAIQTILPTTRITIHRARDLPLSISSPAVLLSVRALDMNSVGSSVSPQEINDITQFMKPHLQLMRLYSTYYEKSHPSAQFSPTLLCSFLKAGYLHILSFASGTSELSTPTVQLIDSLPFTLQCESEDNLLDRMRIAMALFTLQRHVAKICSEWDDSCWPRESLADEHECIVDVTGVATPSPSAYMDHDDKSWWYDRAWMSEGESELESDDTESQEDSNDGTDSREESSDDEQSHDGPSDDENSQKGSPDSQDHDQIYEDSTNTGEKPKDAENPDTLAQGDTEEHRDPDYEEDLNYPEDSDEERENGAYSSSRADALKRLRAHSRRLVCRWIRGLPQKQDDVRPSELSHEDSTMIADLCSSRRCP